MLDAFNPLSAAAGFVTGVLACLVAGKKLLDLIVESWTAKLMDKFDLRYPSRYEFMDLHRRVGELEDK